MDTFLFEQLSIERGVLCALSDKDRSNNILFCVRWKGGLTLRLASRWSYYWITVEKDDSIFNSIRVNNKNNVMKKLQKVIRDIERGQYARSKSTAELVAQIVQERQLTGCMNNTKWNLFRNAMIDEMPFPPPYKIKTLFDNDISHIHAFITWNANYIGSYDDEDFVNLNYKVIEYLTIKTRYCDVSGGKLVEYKTWYDATSNFVELMEKYHIPYTSYQNTNDTFLIYGYQSPATRMLLTECQ